MNKLQEISLLRSALNIAGDFVKRYPRASILTLLALIASGGLDGLGMLSLLPLLEAMRADGPAAATGIGAEIVDVMQGIGITPTIPSMIGFFIIMLILKGLTLYGAQLYMQSVIVGVKRDLRMEMLQALARVRWEYFAGQQAGRLSNLVIHECANTSAVAKQLLTIVSAAVTAFVYIVSALLVSWQFALAAIVAGGAMNLVFQFLVRALRRDGAIFTELMREFSGRLIDWLAGLKPLKAMGMDTRVTNYIADQADALQHVEKRVVAANLAMQHLREPLGAVTVGALLFVGYSVLDVPATSLAVSIALFWRLASKLGEFQKSLSALGNQEQNYYGVRGGLTELEAMREPRAGREAPPDGKLRITFENVSYSYGPDKPSVLQNATMDLRPGAFNALIGPSGSGKSTCLDLIGGLLSPIEGRILVNDHDLASLDTDAWRRCIGYMPQEMVLLHDTVRANLSFKDPDITDAMIWDALAAAGASEFVDHLPKKLDTEVGERGSSLSGGQRQRLALARALIRRPRLLVLDEATSALDAEAEQRLCQHITSLLPDITIVATTHRPAMRQMADHVIRIDHGTAETEATPLSGAAD